VTETFGQPIEHFFQLAAQEVEHADLVTRAERVADRIEAQESDRTAARMLGCGALA
jgi:hypothetical protein